MTTNSKCSKSVESFFDKNVEKYLDSFYKGRGRYPSNSLRKDVMLEFISKSSSQKYISALDIGCGTGSILLELAKMGYKTTGVDISSEMLSECRKNASLENVTVDNLVKADIYELPDSITSQKFDVIVAAGVFGYLPDHMAAFGIIKNMMHKDSVFIVDMNNRLMDMFTLNKFTYYFYKDLFQCQGIDPLIVNEVLLKIKDMLNFSDLENVSMKGDEALPKSIDMTDSNNYNALNYDERFRTYGMKILSKRFLHKHPLPTIFSSKYPAISKDFALSQEAVHKENAWYDSLICSFAVLLAQLD